MKAYSQCLTASMSMPDDPRLRESLKKIFSENEINFMIETGTYLGTGSTKLIIESFPENKKPIKFYTIEVNSYFYKQAVNNLKEFDFVKVIWGRSVHLKDALNFIRNDEAILNHQKYPDIYIDNTKNPVNFYEQEIKGDFNIKLDIYLSLKSYLRNILLRWHENLLEKLLNKYKNQKPFIILDSAGGIGYLEFNIVKNIMNEKTYYLLLDDIYHLKHFRSFYEIKLDPKFRIIDHSLSYRWLLAKHSPASG